MSATLHFSWPLLRKYPGTQLEKQVTQPKSEGSVSRIHVKLHSYTRAFNEPTTIYKGQV